MTTYGAELIYQTNDRYGKIEIVEHQQKFRSLHFGNNTQQSAMLLNNPFLLVHQYTQAMLLPTCWLTPKNVLILGLGSGSIVKHLYNYFRETVIDAVELREEVIDVASEYFLLPDIDERFTIYNKSAFDWLDSNNGEKKYDLIIVDMFLTSKQGKDLAIDVTKYISILHDMLDSNDTIVFNHLGNNAYSYPSYHNLFKIFSGNLFMVDIESTNLILYASRGHVPASISAELLQAYEIQYILPYTHYFNKLNKI